MIGDSGDGGSIVEQSTAIELKTVKYRGKLSTLKKYCIIYLKNNSTAKRGGLTVKSGKMAPGNKAPVGGTKRIKI